MTAWAQASLGQLVDENQGEIKTGPFGSQLHQSDYVDDPAGVTVVMPKDMVEGRINFETAARISHVKALELKQHITQHRDLLLPRRGDLGRRVLIREGDVGAFCGTGSLRVRLAGSPLMPEFLCYYLGTESGLHQLKSKASGVTMPNISTSAVRELEIHFPERDHQRVIVSMLTVYDELIENNLRRIEILEEMAQTIYREWFVNHRFPGHDQKSFVQSTIGPVPDGWRAAKFGDIAMEIRDGVHPSKLDPDTPYVGLEHIPRKSILLSEWGQPSDVSSRKWKYVEGDILFGKLRPYFHKVVWTPGMGVCSTDAIVIRPKDGFAEFALFIASSEEFVGHATSTAGGTDRPRANWIDLAAYPILLPTKRVLERFSEQIEPLVYLMLNLSNQSRNLSITRDLLLPKLISGEIDVSELDIDTSWLAA